MTNLSFQFKKHQILFVGQSIKNVGVWLRKPCFSHGQLYVAVSRASRPTNILIALPEAEEKKTKNIVFKEVF